MIPEIITIAMLLASHQKQDLTPSLGQFLRNGYPINELIISRVLQRLNGQKLIGVN